MENKNSPINDADIADEQLKFKIHTIKNGDTNATINDIVSKIIKINANLIAAYETNIPSFKASFDKLDAEVALNNERKNSATNLEKDFSNLNRQVGDKKNEVYRLNDRIDKLLNRDNLKNDFRIQISYAFITLVAIVIVGFYLIIALKGGQNIVQYLFAGQQGILFITLFLIIISIILFGIMGTLGGEELSALIGAIAGYILGSKTQEPEQMPPISTEDLETLAIMKKNQEALSKIKADPALLEKILS